MGVSWEGLGGGISDNGQWPAKGGLASWFWDACSVVP